MQLHSLQTRYAEILTMSKHIARFASSFVKIHEDRSKTIPLLQKDIYHEEANKTLSRCAHNEQRLLAITKRQLVHAANRLHEILGEVSPLLDKEFSNEKNSSHKKKELKELVDLGHKTIEFFEDIETFFQRSESRLENELIFLETGSKKDFLTFKRSWKKELKALKNVFHREKFMPSVEIKLARTAKLIGLSSFGASALFFKYMLETTPQVAAERGDKFVLLFASVAAFGAGIFYLVKGFSADSGEGVYSKELHEEAKYLSHKKAKNKRNHIKKSKK
ncbi:MAG: hypothetical protein ACOCQQ_02455 [Candidatus Nanoarchaeia archaeon]